MVIDGDFYTYNKVESQFPGVARLTRENEPASYVIEDIENLLSTGDAYEIKDRWNYI